MQKKSMGTVKMVSAVLIILLLAIIHIANPDFFPELWRVLKSGDLIATAEYIESFGSWAVFFSFWLVLFVNMLGFPPAIIFSTSYIRHCTRYHIICSSRDRRSRTLLPDTAFLSA